MGEIDITGPEALQLTDYVTTNAAGRLKTGQIHYSGLLYEHGGFVDDVLVHKVADDHYFLCVNASNQEKDFEHIRAYNRFDAQVRLSSDDYAQIAIQGPNARATLQKLTAADLAAIRYYWFTDGAVRARRPASRAPATPARMATKSMSRPRKPRACGTKSWMPARSSASSPAAWARATRCAWKLKWRSTATKSTPPSRRGKPIWPGS
jgi:folate-binding Fe-S cluster repair protein YgfZ